MRNLYWLPAHCDALPVKLAIAHFDTAYNEGIGEAIEILQHCLGVETDGEWGPITASALQTALAGDEGGILESYLSRRVAVYQLIEEAHPAD
jgi:lysozyme family protein